MKKSKGIITLVCTLLAIIGLGYVAIWGIGTEKAGSAAGIPESF